MGPHFASSHSLHYSAKEELGIIAQALSAIHVATAVPAQGGGVWAHACVAPGLQGWGEATIKDPLRSDVNWQKSGGLQGMARLPTNGETSGFPDFTINPNPVPYGHPPPPTPHNHSRLSWSWNFCVLDWPGLVAKGEGYALAVKTVQSNRYHDEHGGMGRAPREGVGFAPGFVSRARRRAGWGIVFLGNLNPGCSVTGYRRHWQASPQRPVLCTHNHPPSFSTVCITCISPAPIQTLVSRLHHAFFYRYSSPVTW
ncbi:hypothetical protein JZ751_018918 [Albula glossodonta]|uniref:Uncharacterized protein n=1 Tax=Albula glossodonta TaxID=121402 RepID=A0A8T2MTT7_9TELE|nr:hypothetical protein JZ751_018918 [Albula glossodonta]